MSNWYTFIMKRLLHLLSATALVAIALLVVSPSNAEAAYRTVVPGDTLSKMFGTRWQEVHRLNAHLIPDPHWIYPGQVLNDGLGSTAPVQAPAQTVAPAQTAPAPVQTAPVVSRGYGGPNGYGWGWCTWWVKEKRPDIGGYWGNAGYNWLSAARSAGFSTGNAPTAGAIGVMPGHVVYVESVNGNGTVNISEMGWNYTQGNLNYRTVPAHSFVYIY